MVFKSNINSKFLTFKTFLLSSDTLKYISSASTSIANSSACVSMTFVPCYGLIKEVINVLSGNFYKGILSTEIFSISRHCAYDDLHGTEKLPHGKCDQGSPPKTLRVQGPSLNRKGGLYFGNFYIGHSFP